ncbi:hypothetical protein ACPOL_2501 [Acidisarcina polymorpha]|uniref:CAAX prenyl protease 2/Lysostaphin resistance protein A-like domain-containing protein n=1 Tax=Acidisarcina polymorpha TaxID=2211140 RepID=A0A2Z5FY46_9BACT|nr:CPBP family intramembrane glutamic endopeptidase [Acidisarcina polymorpha]AXC11823.1 hypothetical protein ACPOL_2501 [Acidisarcina polymorpha]
MAVGKAELPLVEDPGATASRQRDIVELSVGYGLILLVIWMPSPWQRPLYLAAAIFIFAASWKSFDDWADIGLRTENLLQSIWIVVAAIAAAAIAVMVAEKLQTLRPWRGPFELIQRFWGYAIWAFAQQFLLQDFFLSRFRRLFKSKVLAVVLATGVFALAHLPNPILTVATVVWGFAACWLFLHYHNLIPLAIAHAVLGICIAITFLGNVTHNMRVGLGYLAYRPRHGHIRRSIPSALPQP